MTTKDTNPKDAVGTRKIPFSAVPATVIGELALAMLEGARKYGRHNYRVVGVRASVYYDAALRHLTAWWEGEDLDPDSGVHHIVKALACLTILRDAGLQRKLTDDRPPKAAVSDWVVRLNRCAERIVDSHNNPVPPYTQDRHGEQDSGEGVVA